MVNRLFDYLNFNRFNYQKKWIMATELSSNEIESQPNLAALTRALRAIGLKLFEDSQDPKWLDLQTVVTYIQDKQVYDPLRWARPSDRSSQKQNIKYVHPLKMDDEDRILSRLQQKSVHSLD